MAAEGLRLYGYWRSSASYRVRIALNLKGLPYETIPINLVKHGGEHLTPQYADVNPQQFVPVLQHGERVLRQSLAIIEYIDETFDGPRLLPATARERARARALAQLVACDIHPLNNRRVLAYLENEHHTPQIERDAWVRHWIDEGFRPLEVLLEENPSTGDFCEGDTPSIADVCLVPQVYNAIRFSVDLSPYPTIRRIYQRCLEVPAIEAARPEKQPDAPVPTVVA